MRTAILVAAAAYAFGARAQDLSATNNVTSLEGTWSSNPSMSTGGSFCVPAENKFNPPNNTGISYSFTDDGFFEEAQYQFDSNGARPECIAAKLIFQHGTYELKGDSIVLHPFESDGRIQVQNACAAVSTNVYYYAETVTFKDWGITIDQSTANYKLQLNAFDGRKLAPLLLTARPPNMLPTQVLYGTNETGQAISRKRSAVFERFQKRYSGASSYSMPSLMVGLGGTLAAVVTFSLALF
ncbi:hypothetical protein CcaverHIS002_0108270 [Cutaneotrichosporon cavernicola]|uniref:Protein ROT1 n=1 Tax=Cutaneotrichosporon cavernicola TaxID=279322 RepID=A0AA48L0X3_9TREE|nr:uncharacterized protein CcaverHIS019_0108200 [Cutaneotrichosporon cavernicola]BEI80298.1 hypothetical protein CcaverHIS002_0108270 [Cutaneotrichosporon cavernicola]BEI88102.1 hypothetical protein CcaverHIS019_0108200 [Cutaneotrichosporon cavernicola]BEI95873.1 hypothetical protein CcaverHIS631_0108220 [Cutaneotrichosporon cavernicola]BEJ03647.1 hypothetical protein CcaverHIS641_0108220 [Cutaneotrichosporon cavernicola]